MRLWIDGQCLQSSSRFRGIGRYVHDFIRSLAIEHPEIEISISFNAALEDEAIIARDVVTSFIKPQNIHVWEGIAEPGEAAYGLTARRELSELALAHHVACLQPDFALSASPFEGMNDATVPLLPVSAQTFPIGCIFYDAIPYRFSSRYLNGDGLKRCYDRRLALHRNFDFLFAISEFSRKEAEDILPGAFVTTIYAGINEEFSRLRDESKAGGVSLREEEFLLYVGGLDWRKNVDRVIDAFALLPTALREKLQFVVVGDAPPYMLSAISALWDNHGLPQRNLRIQGHIADQALVELYLKARAVIQPSLMEGFGLTALEALSCDIPVIASNAGALPEVIGVPELLFDPTSAQDISQRIALVCADRTQVTMLTARARIQAEQYTWKRSSDIASGVLRKLQDGKTVKLSPTIEELRLVRVRDIAKVAIDHDIKGRALAIAEPRRQEAPRLLIDVTATARVDHATGIQRVVKKTVTSLSRQQSGPEWNGNCLVFCDGRDGFFEAHVEAEKPIFQGKAENSAIFPGAGDVLLMLDSSWEFYDAHRKVLRDARLRGAEVISTLYDLVPIKVPAFCDPGMPPLFTQWLETALAYSTGFVCISKAVANELLDLLSAIRFPRTLKVGYWHLGADFATSEVVINEAGTEEHTLRFLMVGTMEPRKGHRIALDAFDELWRRGFEGQLTIVGKRGWSMKHLVDRIRNHQEYGRKLHWIEKASDEELQRHYLSCDALIAASYMEGFGLPIVEAAAYGKPVIASDIPVFREVSGESESVMFFEVGSPEALSSCLQAFSKHIHKDSSTRADFFTWDKSAQELVRVVTGGRWYRTYHPGAKEFIRPSLERDIAVAKSQSKSVELLHRLELVEGPFLADDGKTWRSVVKVSNRSSVTWSRRGDENGSSAVQLAYRVVEAGASLHTLMSDTVEIPFILGANDSLYMPVDVHGGWLDQRNRFLEVEMAQRSGERWGAPLRIPLT